MLTYNLGEKNKYYSLYRAIRADILCGKLTRGEKLPGKRSLAQHLGVSVTTVLYAYQQLLAEGYICGVERKGYFVAEVNAEHVPPAPLTRTLEPEKIKEEYALDLTSGSAPAELFPFSVWARLMRETLSDEGEHLLKRCPCDGDPALKRAIAGYLYRFRGFSVDPRYIVVGAGAEYLYGVIVQLLGRGAYAVENPCYDKAYKSYVLNGAKFLPIPVKSGGVDPEAVEKSCAIALHISPAHQYPTGEVMPAGRRSRLLKWARGAGAYIIEDDYDSEFRLFGKPLQPMAAMDGERVIYLNTFSKTLAPSMRLGYMVLPPLLYGRYISLFGDSANVVPLFEQITLTKMLDGGYFERHVNRMKNYYKAVRSRIISGIESIPQNKEIIETGGGLHITLRLPDFESDTEIKLAAKRAGIKLKCLTDYLNAPCVGYEKIAVINYSSVRKDAELKNFSLIAK